MKFDVFTNMRTFQIEAEGSLAAYYAALEALGTGEYMKVLSQSDVTEQIMAPKGLVETLTGEI